MLKDIQAGKVGAVVVYHQDRLHRDVMELLVFAELAVEHDLKLATVKQCCGQPPSLRGAQGIGVENRDMPRVDRPFRPGVEVAVRPLGTQWDRCIATRRIEVRSKGQTKS